MVAKTGKIRVKSYPLGAYVELDNSYRQTTDYTYTVVPVGIHTVDVYFDKNDPSKSLGIELEVMADTLLTVSADFKAHTIVHDGKYVVSIDSDPPGTLFVDNKRIGVTPQTM